MAAEVLQKLCTFLNGGTPSKKNSEFFQGDIPWISSADISNGFVTQPRHHITKQAIEQSATNLVPKGTVLLVTRTGVGKVTVAPFDLCFSQDITAIIPQKNVNLIPEYLAYFLRSCESAIRSQQRGATIQGVTRDTLTNLKIPLLNSLQQKRIVDNLNLAKSLEIKRSESIMELDNYIRSLFIEMFGDPTTNPMRWPIKKLSELANKITDGTHKTPKYQDSGIIFLSAKNVKNGELDQVGPKYISEKEHQDLIRRCKPEKGDIVLTKSGSLGDPAIVKFDFEFSIFESLALIKPKPEVLSTYLYSYLALPQTKVRLLKEQKGIGVRHLHLVDLRELEVQLPPMELQKTFSDKLKQVNVLKETLRKSRQDVNSLFTSLLSEAFQ